MDNVQHPRNPSALQEMRRVLRPGGRLFFVEHGRATEPRVRWWQDHLTPAWKHLSGGCPLNRAIDEFVENAGFRIERYLRHCDNSHCGRFLALWDVGVVVSIRSPRVSPTSLQLLRSSIRYKICLKKPSFFSWGADTAIQKSFPRQLGACSVKRRRAGVGSRRSAISCTTTSHSAMSMPAPQEQPGKRSTSGAGSAAITRILLLPFADA